MAAHNVLAQPVKIEGITLDLVRKRIRYLNLTVYPPDGRVRVSAPLRVSERDIRDFVAARKEWIERQREKVRQMPVVPALRYETGEAHFFQGHAHRLEVIETDRSRGRAERYPAGRTIQLFAPAGAGKAVREKILLKWYRDELTRLIPPVLARWEAVAGVEAHTWGVKRMKTKWGTCNPRAKRSWISLDLVKKSPECLDYIMIHELTHLLERGHGPRFKTFMDRFMPGWRLRRTELRAHPVATQAAD